MWSQITRDGQPVRIDHVVIAASHTDEVVTPDGKYTTEEAKKQIVDAVVGPVAGHLVDAKTKVTVNGTEPTPVCTLESVNCLQPARRVCDQAGGQLRRNWGIAVPLKLPQRDAINQFECKVVVAGIVPGIDRGGAAEGACRPARRPGDPA